MDSLSKSESTRSRQGLTLADVERRERHLWSATLFLLLLLVIVTVITFSVLVQAGGSGIARPTALIGLALLTVLFCIYAVQTRASFDAVRRLYRQQAMRDPLTRLLNRQSFAERFDAEVNRASHEGKSFPILLCDLDHFKQLNDARGHLFGDQVLKRVAGSFLEATRGSDLVFRWGGDEFLVLLSVPTREGALIAAQRIRDSVARVSKDIDMPLDLSIGVAVFPEHGRDGNKLISVADRALYIAKKSGDKINVGDEEHRVAKDSVKIVFQPVVDVESREVVGYEALSRDPNGEVDVAGLFRRYAAVNRLIELKKMILRRQVEMAGELGLAKVFINVDFESLRATGPFDKPDGIEVILEVSENESFHDVEGLLEVANAWRARGYRFAIDDFGSGLLSLPFIARLIPEYIKVDRSLVVQASGSERFGLFLKDMVLALRNYSKEGIIAEGIETEEDFDIVRRLGVDQVQGYLTGRPKSMD